MGINWGYDARNFVHFGFFVLGSRRERMGIKCGKPMESFRPGFQSTCSVASTQRARCGARSRRPGVHCRRILSSATRADNLEGILSFPRSSKWILRFLSRFFSSPSPSSGWWRVLWWRVLCTGRGVEEILLTFSLSRG